MPASDEEDFHARRAAGGYPAPGRLGNRGALRARRSCCEAEGLRLVYVINSKRSPLLLADTFLRFTRAMAPVGRRVADRNFRRKEPSNEDRDEKPQHQVWRARALVA